MLRRILVALLAAVALLSAGCIGNESRGGTPDANSSLPSPGWAEGLTVITSAKLPEQARTTLRLIDEGGPFPYEKDGSVFGNHEGLLPKQDRGHYREYTVPTPGERDRGARRIVAGADRERYYTSDHYESFKAVVTP
ncbi:ribonuclease N [Streptomyces sp. XM4193]|uniref:ribonuclease domain-containing protein n=1 Tax=Streptomyces sp. XM4193 TaxID=2929782 RepID=UPI001FF7BCDE|nr:ribonuclease domain-containing protein [Streptomyces sp. XM4193]MCK1796563.1 ribonuclease N [Streptomyces sp. XM4193]